MNKKSREIILLVLFILIFISLLLSVSYAYYTFNPDFGKGEGEIGMSLPSCAMVTMSDKNQINLVGDYALPVKDNRLLNSSEEVLSNYRYSFTLTNNCDKNAEITLVFVPTAESNMPISAVKYLINESNTEITDKTGKFLSSEEVKPDETLIQDLRMEKGYELAENIYKMEKVTVPAGTSLNLDVFFWIDYNEGDITGNSNNITMNKTFSGFILASNFEDVGSNLAYCEENNITSFSECLIRSDSNKSLEEANKAIDARTSTMDLSNLKDIEPSKVYAPVVEALRNDYWSYSVFSYVEESVIPFYEGTSTSDLQNITFDNSTGNFQMQNIKYGSIDDIITTEEDIKNGIYKVTMGAKALPRNELYIVTEANGYNVLSGYYITSKDSGITKSMPGLYKVPDKYTIENENLSYMYRGDVIKNWVKFGTETVWVGYNNANSTGVPREYKTEELCNNSTSGYKYNCTPIEADIYWRIVRINGNGSVRMIYSGNNLEEKLENITDSHTSGTYTGILTNSSKGGNSRTSRYNKTLSNGIEISTSTSYLGYMYNPKLVLSSEISKQDYFVGNAKLFFFTDFDMNKNCSEENSTCTLTCTNYDSNLKKGDNCVYSDWESLANKEENYIQDGSTYNYIGKYKYFCTSAQSTEDGNNYNVSCTSVKEAISLYNTSTTLRFDRIRVNTYAFISPSKEEADKNIENSQAKDEIDEWYELNFANKNENNALITDYLADEGFCNDRSLYSGNGYNNNTVYSGRKRNVSDYNPTLICPRPEIDEFTTSASSDGNKSLIYPIGMITTDEAMLAGMQYAIVNNDNYLSIGTNYWTLTPSYLYFVESSSKYVGLVRYDNSLFVGAEASHNLRPVINLSKDVLYAGGSGLKGDPYIVKLGS